MPGRWSIRALALLIAFDSVSFLIEETNPSSMNAGMICSSGRKSSALPNCIVEDGRSYLDSANKGRLDASNHVQSIISIAKLDSIVRLLYGAGSMTLPHG